MTDSAPTSIGAIRHYNLLERLEPSGPGELFRARDTRVGRTVLIRWLPAGFPGDAATRARLIEQAQVAVALSHPNIATVFEAAEHDERVYVVFEFLSGQPLRAEMAGHPMNAKKAVDLAVQMADGVAEAHTAGFGHGALSPETIVITAKGSAKIPAFGLAMRSGFRDAPDQARPRDYGSPEEARGEKPDERSDIHSVGALLFEMLTGRRPSNSGAARPSASNPQVPADLDEVVLKAIAPNPETRHQSAVTLAAELRRVAAGLSGRGSATTQNVRDRPGDHTYGAERATARGWTLPVVALVVLVLALLAWGVLQ